MSTSPRWYVVLAVLSFSLAAAVPVAPAAAEGSMSRCYTCR